jgi:hypothetical protein
LQVNNEVQSFKSIYDTLNRTLSAIYDDDSVTEFLYEYAWPDYKRLLQVQRAAQTIRQTKSFIARPLDFSRQRSEMQELLQPPPDTPVISGSIPINHP